MNSSKPDETSIGERREEVRQAMLTGSRTIQSPNFLRVEAADLTRLFGVYDRLFFGKSLAAAVQRDAAGGLSFEWSRRLRSSGGVTTRLRRGGVLSYKIAISQSLLMDNFRDGQPLTVVGLACADRLDALMRIMEHELLHLHEFLTYGRSNCARPRFQGLAKRHFGHAAHQHRLTTPRQRVLASTHLRPGAMVAFTHDGRTLNGRINRIHTRATVLVQSINGVRYTDGKRYEKFYVPVARLREVL